MIDAGEGLRRSASVVKWIGHVTVVLATLGLIAASQSREPALGAVIAVGFGVVVAIPAYAIGYVVAGFARRA